MSDGFESRFQQALTSLAERRTPASDDVRATAVTTLADLMLDSARIGNTRLPEHFSELMLALLPRVGPRVRLDIARRLAHCDLVPVEVVRLLADDEPEVAGPMLRQSPLLDAGDLHDIATGPSDEKARAIAGRADLPGDVVGALVDRGDPVIGASLALSPSRFLTDDLAERLARVPDLPGVAARRLIELAELSDAALSDLFWVVDHDARGRILDRIARRRRELARRDAGAPAPAAGARDPQADALGQALFALAAAGERAELAVRLGEALRLPREVARRIVDDAQGEALAVAARAADLPTDRITGIVLLAVPDAGTSLDALKRLVALAEQLEPETARTVVALWSGTPATARRASRHEPAIARPAARSPRPAAAPAPRRLEDVVADAIRRTAG